MVTTIKTPWPHISMINTVTYKCLCQNKENAFFQINLVLGQKSLERASYVSSLDADLSDIPCDYHQYADMFCKQGTKTLPQHCPFNLFIQIKDGKTPSLGPIYSLSALELQTLWDFIDENLKTRLIRPLQSPYEIPILFVKKKNGSLRLCVNYWGLNKITRKDCYFIPLVSDLLDAPQKARIYSKLDLRSAYHLIRIAEGNKWKTAFRMQHGLYEWLVMPFGLSNAPLAFQRLMNEIFTDLLDVYVVIYLNNILIYLDNLRAHKQHIEEVLWCLWSHRLYASPSKCVFHKERVEFLGCILSPQSLQIDEEKVCTIKEWPVPRWVKDVQIFLGFTNFYRRFIYNYSELSVLLI